MDYMANKLFLVDSNNNWIGAVVETVNCIEATKNCTVNWSAGSVSVFSADYSSVTSTTINVPAGDYYIIMVNSETGKLVAKSDKFKIENQ